MLLSCSDTKQTLMRQFLSKAPPRENWFRYVRREYATAINFPCRITSSRINYLTIYYFKFQVSLKKWVAHNVADKIGGNYQNKHFLKLE